MKTKIIMPILLVFAILFAGLASAYTQAEVSQHSIDSDCWVIISDKVYDITPIIIWHADVITCGADNTAVYLAKHRTLANINPYYLGDINSVISDTIVPVITFLGRNPINLVQGDNYMDAGATAIDDVDGAVIVSTTGTVDTITVGTYILTYTATDAAGNTATATRTVNVAAPQPTPDTIPPVISMIGASIVDVVQGTAYADVGATAIDDVDGYIGFTAEPIVDTSRIGTYTVTYTATDAAGNTATATRKVNVIAAQPTPTLPNFSWEEFNVHNTPDNCWVIVFGNVYNVTEVMPTYGDFYLCGQDNTAKWLASIFGNDTTIMNPYLIGQFIGEVPTPDTTPPMISLNGASIVDVVQGTAYADDGATAIDDVDGAVIVSTTGTVDTTTVGTYILTYTATDAADNTATAIRTLNVVTAPPVETPPVETPPVETPPVETPPVETPPTTHDDEEDDEDDREDREERNSRESRDDSEERDGRENKKSHRNDGDDDRKKDKNRNRHKNSRGDD